MLFILSSFTFLIVYGYVQIESRTKRAYPVEPQNYCSFEIVVDEFTVSIKNVGPETLENCEIKLTADFTIIDGSVVGYTEVPLTYETWGQNETKILTCFKPYYPKRIVFSGKAQSKLPQYRTWILSSPGN